MQTFFLEDRITTYGMTYTLRQCFDNYSLGPFLYRDGSVVKGEGVGETVRMNRR